MQMDAPPIVPVDHQIGVAAFLAALLGIAIWNAIYLQRVEKQAARLRKAVPPHLPRASILVPARNEENNIEACVRSCVGQNYPDFEVIALDDDSQDRTGQILAGLAKQHPQLRVINGKPLPVGWLGKTWACHQLAQAANGELLLFSDADTTHHPQALVEAIKVLLGEGSDFLTAWPRQIVGTWGERLVVPIIYWSIFSLLPIPVALRTRWPVFSSAIGQFLLFRKSAYDRIGGHSDVRHHTAEDLELARKVKAANLRWSAVDAGKRVECRMYRNFREAFDGLSKNLFAAFDYRLLPFTFAWVWMGIVSLEPAALLLLGVLGWPIPAINLGWAALAAGLAFFSWSLVLWRFRFPIYLAFFYPVCSLLAVTIAAHSLYLHLTGLATWKGRVVIQPKIRFW